MKSLEQWKQLWMRLSGTQRAILAGGTLGAVLLVGLLVKTMGSPEMKPLLTGMEREDAQALSQQLTAKGIAHKVSPDGKEIDVDADKLDEARMEVASQGTAHTGRMGFELFDKTSWGQTEFDEQVNYQRALEGELERTIATLNGVKSVRVHLVLPHSSVFLEKDRAAKASVTLRLKGGRMYDQQLQAISRLVSGAVDDLAPADVAIIDADNNQPLTRAGSGAGGELEAQLTKRLMETLGPVVGLDNLRASVNVEYELRSVEENADEYDPAVSALLTTTKSSDQAGGADAAGGVAGTSSNIASPGAAPDTQAADAQQTQTSSNESSTFGVNKVERHTASPAGGIRRLTAAILVNDTVKKKIVSGKVVADSSRRTPAELEQLKTLAAAVLGADAARGDLVTVENMTFAGADEVEAPLPLAQRVREMVPVLATPLRYASLFGLLLLVWALLLRPVQKQLAVSLEQMTKELPAPRSEKALGVPGSAQDTLEQMLMPDVSTVGLKQRLSEMVQAEPSAMARTVRSWLQEPSQ